VESVQDAVLLTGCFGSGKSTVAVEIADQLDHRGTRYALLDLDFLGWFGLGNHDDANLSPLLLANLTSVAANYRRAGIERFVLAHTTDGADEVQRIRAALGAPLRVVRLIVPLDVVERRLAPAPTSGREHDLRRARTWLEQGLGLDVEDLEVSNDRPVSEVAAEIVAWLGWR
jgi:AAA domain